MYLYSPCTTIYGILFEICTIVYTAKYGTKNWVFDHNLVGTEIPVFTIALGSASEEIL